MNVSPKQIASALILATVFAAGLKVSAWHWSGKYDRLEMQHAERIEEQRQRLLSRQQTINELTQAREAELLRDLENTREKFELLETEIRYAPLEVEKIIRVHEPGEAVDCGVLIDWREFGRLYDRAAATGPAAEAGSTSGGNAAGERAADVR